MPLGTDSTTVVPGIPSGSLSVDIALGGNGFPRGRIIEVFGPESSGKTTLALHAVAAAQKNGRTLFQDIRAGLQYGLHKLFEHSITQSFSAVGSQRCTLPAHVHLPLPADCYRSVANLVWGVVQPVIRHQTNKS